MAGEQVYRLGLIGYPLWHSLSPRIHTAALQALGLKGEYHLYPVPPLPEGEEELGYLLRRVSDGSLHGLNVTIPHKTSVLPWIQELTPIAAAVGAVNTVFVSDGGLVGDNTDIPGFQHDVSRLLPRGIQPGAALVLGAGGSARAVVYALLQMGWRVTVAARRVDQAEHLLESLPDNTTGSTRLPGGAIELNPGRMEKFIASLDQHEPALIVNTTPAGMSPDSEASPWPDGLPLPTRGFVYDLVYNPPETRLVRQARLSGLPATNGLGMLVEQAAIAFERWTGHTAPREAMADSVGIELNVKE
jgi:shikimate dehydrogenase